MSPSPKPRDRRLLHETTKTLMGRIETFVFVVQALWILVTARVDAVGPNGELVLYTIAALHFVAAAVAYFKGGPLQHGGAWLVLWIGLAFLMPLVMVSLVPPGAYGSSPACVQLCGYPVPQIALLAFYPWLILRNTFMRPAADILLLAAVIAEPLVLIMLTHDYLTSVNLTSWGVTAVGYLIGYGFGIAMGRLCTAAVEAQVAARENAYGELYRDLHDETEKTLLVARDHALEGRNLRVIQALAALLAYAQSKRRSLMEQQQATSIASLIESQVEVYDEIFPDLRVHGLGPLTARQPVARLVSQGLGALLKNAQAHSGAVAVEITPWVDRGFLVIEVADDGRGFPSGELDDPSNNLYRLRQDARHLDGDLLKIGERPGSCLQLWVPLHPIE